MIDTLVDKAWRKDASRRVVDIFSHCFVSPNFSGKAFQSAGAHVLSKLLPITRRKCSLCLQHCAQHREYLNTFPCSSNVCPSYLPTSCLYAHLSLQGMKTRREGLSPSERHTRRTRLQSEAKVPRNQNTLSNALSSLYLHVCEISPQRFELG